MTNDIKWLACRPLEIARRYSKYIVNGFRFQTKTHERCLKTQNKGIVLTFTTFSYASSRDKSPKEGDIHYYGALTNINRG